MITKVLYAILCQYCAVIKNMAFRKLHKDCNGTCDKRECICLQFSSGNFSVILRTHEQSISILAGCHDDGRQNVYTAAPWMHSTNLDLCTVSWNTSHYKAFIHLFFPFIFAAQWQLHVQIAIHKWNVTICGKLNISFLFLFLISSACNNWYCAFAYLLALNQKALTVHFIMKPLWLPTIAPFCFLIENIVHGIRPCVDKHWRYIFGTLITINTITAPKV